MSIHMSDRDKKTVKIGGIVLAAALVLKFAVVPAYDAWSAAREKVDGYETRLVSMRRMLDERAMARQMLRIKYGDAIDAPLLSEEQTRVAFPQAVQDALRNGGMNIQSIQVPSVRRVRELSGVSMVTVRVEGSCGGDALPRVLAALRSCERWAVVEDFQTTMAQAGNRGNWTIRMTISTPAVSGAQP